MINKNYRGEILHQIMIHGPLSDGSSRFLGIDSGTGEDKGLVRVGEWYLLEVGEKQVASFHGPVVDNYRARMDFR